MIKRILQFLMLVTVCISAHGQASGLSDLKFGQYQIADSQWNVSACMYTATCQIYSKNPGTAYQIPWYNGQLSWGAGDYVAFVPTGDTTNPWNAVQYSANGTQKAVMGTGHIINMGTDYFFFVGNDNDTGQLFSMTQGFANTSGVTWTGTLNPTVAQTNAYAVNGSTTPLAAGQTAAPAAPVITVTGTAVTYTTRTVVSGNTTTVYRTPVTTTTYSDGSTTSANGTEALYQTRVASTVVTNKIVGNTLTTYNTPINKVTTGGVTTIESNGAVVTTTQTVQQGLTYQVWRYDYRNYSCGIFGCIAIPFSYRVPSTNANDYGNTVRNGVTSGGMYLQTNARLPNGDGSLLTYNDGTVIRYTGTITAPITTARPAGTVYRLYFYNQTDDGFVLRINSGTIINNSQTDQWQAIGGNYNSNGWIDVVAGQSYNLEAWYWNVLGGVGHRFYWDYGDGIKTVPNSAFTTGVISAATIDTTGAVYSNSSVVDISGTAVSMYPSYVTIGTGTPGEMIFGSDSGIATEQQTKVNTWTNKTIPNGNSIYIDQVSGSGNTVTMEQDGNRNQITATLDGSTNAITVKQGTPGIGQNEIKLGVTGSYNALDISQARTDQGLVTGSNGQYHDATVNGFNNTVTARQSNTGGVGGHYMETTVNGNQNSVTARQTDNGNKIMFTTVTGNNNTVDAVQKGTGQHYLENKLTGNGNSVSAVQEGNITNRATLDLTNNGGPASVILNQTGGQNVSITTGCATAGGCAPITVRQGY